MKLSSLMTLTLLTALASCGKNHYLVQDPTEFKKSNVALATNAGAAGGNIGGIDVGSITGGSSTGGSSTGGSSTGGSSTGGSSTGGSTTGGSTTGGSTTGGATTGGATTGGATTGGATTGGSTTGGSTTGGSTTGGSTTGGSTTGGSTTGGSTTGGSTTGGSTTGGHTDECKHEHKDCKDKDHKDCKDKDHKDCKDKDHKDCKDKDHKDCKDKDHKDCKDKDHKDCKDKDHKDCKDKDHKDCKDKDHKDGKDKDHKDCKDKDHKDGKDGKDKDHKDCKDKDHKHDESKSCEQRLEVYEDDNNDGDGDKYLGNIKCFEGAISAMENYNYSSKSSVVKIGPKELPHQSRAFCYKNGQGIFLMMSHHKDNTGSPAGNNVIWDIKTSNNNGADNVIVSDEPNSGVNDAPELSLVSSMNMEKNYTGNWNYQKDTDGGVIGPFKSQFFKIVIDVKEIGNINHTQFFSADNQHKGMNQCHKSSKSFILISKEVCK